MENEKWANNLIVLGNNSTNNIESWASEWFWNWSGKK